MADEVYWNERPMGGRNSVVQSANADVSTDTNGDGSATVTFNFEWATNTDFSIQVSAEDTAATVSYEQTDPASTWHNEVTVHVRGAATTSGTVHASITVFAERTQLV